MHTLEELEHHAQSLQLLMHIRSMGLVNNIEQRIMECAGLSWMAAASILVDGGKVPKKWLNVIEKWQEQFKLRHPTFPQYPEYMDDIVLMALTTTRPT